MKVYLMNYSFECAICGKPIDSLKDVHTMFFNELIYCKECFENAMMEGENDYYTNKIWDSISD